MRIIIILIILLISSSALAYPSIRNLFTQSQVNLIRNSADHHSTLKIYDSLSTDDNSNIDNILSFETIKLREGKIFTINNPVNILGRDKTYTNFIYFPSKPTIETTREPNLAIIEFNQPYNSVYSSIETNDVTLKFNSTATFSGTTEFSFNLGKNNYSQLIINGPQNTLDFSNSSAVFLIKVLPTANIDLSNLRTIFLIKILPTADASHNYILLKAENGATIKAPGVENIIYDITNNSGKPIVKWDFDKSTYTLYPTIQVDQLLTYIQTAGGNKDDLAIAQALATDANPTDQARIVQGRIANLTNPREALSLIQQLKDSEDEIEISTITSVQAAQNEFSNRLNFFLNSSDFVRMLFVENSGYHAETGIASGESEPKHGVWISPFVGKVNQKTSGSNPGYKSELYGFSGGWDTKLSEEIIVGLGYSYMHNDLNHNKDKLASGAKVSTNLFSLYGIFDTHTNWAFQGVFSYGLNRIETHNLRELALDMVTPAKSKYTARSYNIEVIGGPRFNVSNLVIYPQAGLRYDGTSSPAHQETSTNSEQTLFTSKNSSSKLEGIAGTQLVMLHHINNITIKPEISAYVNFEVMRKGRNGYVRINGLSTTLPIKDTNSKKPWYSLGTGVTLENKNTEFSTFYEAQIDHGYLGHQLSASARLNF